MKSIKAVLLFVSLLMTTIVSSQTGLNFQGVARNESGVILASQELTLKLSILQGSADGVVEFSEIRKTTTNAQGLFSVVIGDTKSISALGNFNAIDWKLAPKFLKIEMDIAGGENFSTIGTTQLQSAAYAKFAESADATNLNGIVPITKGGTGTTTGVTKTMVGLGNVDNTSDLNKPISTATQTALDLKASSTQLNTKEDAANKSNNVLTDATSDIKYPTVKSVKTYIDNKVLSGVFDATDTTKGKIQLAGALTGTAALPAIANNAIGSDQIKDASVTDAKIVNIAGTKIVGNIDGNASNITGVVTITNGGTGANNANDARANLGLTIGVNVESPLTVTGPITRVNNAIGMPVASSGVNGYLSSTDWTNFNNKINASEKGANNGVASLGADGKIPSVQIPAISFQSANVVANQTAMLALSNAVEGSIAIRTDNSKNYVLSTTPASTLSNWIELATPSSVSSVNGFAGPNVSLTTDNIAEGSTNKYYSNVQARNAIGATAPLTYDASTGGIALPRASMIQAGYLDYTDWIAFDSKMGTASATATFVPYTGATGPVNLGNYDLTVNGMTAGRGAGGFVSNTALGVEVLMSNTTGLYNTALGNGALKVNTTGFDNISLGSGTLYYNTTGFYNTASGGLALHYNTGGNYNTATGGKSLIQNINGNNNTAVGYNSLLNNLNSSNNTAIGFGADISVDGITNATAIGSMAKVNASNTIQLGNVNITDVKTAGKLTTGAVTYPNTLGTSGQILSTTGAGTLTWTSITGVSSETITTTSLSEPFDITVETGMDGSSIDIRTAENLANGLGSLASNTDGIANLAVGIRTLKNNTVGSANTAIGFESLFNNTTGYVNTAVGAYALRSNTTGLANTAIGSTSLLSNTTGGGNSALGEWTLMSSTTGSRNTAIGTNSMLKLTTGSGNTGVGFNTLFNSISGNRNTAVGEGALFALTNGSNNTTLGYAADVATGNLNNATAIGYYAQVAASNSIQLGNSEVTDVKTAGKLTTGTVTYPNAHGTNGQILSTTGAGTLTWTSPTTTDLSNITGVLSIAKGGTGTSTQNFVDLTADQTINGIKTFSKGASFNGVYIGIGQNSSGAFATTNIAIGPSSLYSNTTGSTNIAIGSSTLGLNTSGSYNSGIGFSALSNNSTGIYNTAMGLQSILNNTTGGSNTAIGVYSLVNNTTGSNNTALGYAALTTNTIGNSNTAVGNNANVASNNLGNATAIGSGAIVNASNSIQLGNGSITDVKTAGKLTTGAVTYPNAHGTSGQVLSTTGAGTLTWTNPTDLSNITGVLSIAKGGTGTSTQNFVDLTADQTIAGTKTFSSGTLALGLSNRGANTSALSFPSTDDPAFISHYTAGNVGRMFFSAGDDATVDYFSFGHGLQNNFTEKLNIYADGRLTAPVDATINGLTIGKGNGNLFGNTVIGNVALANNSVGQYNAAFGNAALRFNISGSANTALGNEALQSNTSGSLNVAVGASTLQANTSGSENTALGSSAMYLNTTGAKNTALGYYALRSNTIGMENTATGDMALYGNTEGNYNTANGTWALYANNVGSYNTSVGHNSITYNTSGNKNTSVGAFSLYRITNTSNNTSVGAYSLFHNTGSGNTSMGVDALYNNTLGEQNIAFGNSALGSNISGGNNTALGHSALYNNQTGSNNTAIGAGANMQSTNLTNATAIGSGAIATYSNTVQLGNSNVVNVKTAGSLTAGAVTYPNTHGTSGQILTTTGSGTLTWTAPVTHYVGESYGGGIVFYVYDNGQHGLIAATADQANDMRWYAYNGGYVISMAYANGIGAGSKNTNMIISRLGIGDATVYAARACNEYSVTSGGVTYGDWYLPSKYELNLLRDAKDVVGNFSSAFYWSSTENDANTVWGQNFDSTTTQSTMDKGTAASNHVRAIRSF